MTKKRILKKMATILLLCYSSLTFSQNVATFDDLPLTSSSIWNGDDNSGGFLNSGYFFENNYTNFGGGLYAWYGFAYSNMADTLTADYTNQFSSITGKGALESSTYAVSYVNYDWMNNYLMHPNVIRFTTPKIVNGFYATNSTYAYFSMLNGDGALSKKFGGLSGNDADWLKLEIKGYSNGIITDTVDFFLADFRFTNNAADYILKTWKWVDLSVLGAVDSLTFGLTSSDNGAYGMNTPAYFCMDNFNGQNIDVGVKNQINSTLQINMYPNPFLETLHISNNNSKEAFNVNIYDMKGAEILKSRSIHHEFTTNLTGLPSGIYFVKVSGSDFNYYQKVVKQ